MFFRKKKTEDDGRKHYELILGLEFNGDRVYISSAVLEEIMNTAYNFGVEILKSEEAQYNNTMRIEMKCTYTEIQVMICELRKCFPKIKIIKFNTK